MNAQHLQRSELLSKPTANSVSIRLQFDTLVNAKLYYGKTKNELYDSTQTIQFQSNQFGTIVLENLTANSKYYYQLQYQVVGNDSLFKRPIYSFQTAKTSAQSFTFLVQADPHLDNQTDSLILFRSCENQLTDNADFLIDLGDFIMTDKLRNANKIVTTDTLNYRCNLLSSYYEKMAHSLPLFIALGNHEGEAGWNLNGTKDNIAVWNTNLRNQFFPNPKPNSFYKGDTNSYAFVGQRAAYYAWNWGNALFVVLDPYWHTNTKPDSLNGWRWTLGKVQYDWLKQTLANSNATFKFVFAHQLIGGDPDGRGGVEFADLYEWGGKNLDRTEGFSVQRPGWEMPIKDLFKKYRVNVFFHGHDHFFAKQEKDCLIYQESPQPGHPNFSNAGQAKIYGYLEGDIIPNSGYIRVNVDSNKVKVEYVRTYKAADETANRKNKDVSNTYFINKINCYDSLNTASPVLWNKQYIDELVFPNPFSVNTTFQFQLKQTQAINIEIYSLNGQLIKTLLQSNQLAAGQYQITWDGTDQFNALQSEGMYVYQIKSNSQVLKTGKLIFKK